MTCAICLNDGNIKTMYNDCIIESLEKIKFHYMSLKSKLFENEQFTKSLRDENDKLKKTISDYEEVERNSPKKRRTASCEEGGDTDSEISFSQNVATKSIAQKSSDDLNKALNFDEEFDLSFIPNTQIENNEVDEKKRDKKTVFREPLKSLPVKPTQLENKAISIKQEVKSNESVENQCDNSVAGLKKSSSWISKENDLKKSVLGSVQKRPNRSLRLNKKEKKTTSMSLKPGQLRQTRLQLDMSKNLSSTFSDTTFCDEAIEASPNADSSVKRINSSKQWQLRSISSKLIKPDNDSLLEFPKKTSPKQSKSQSPPQNKPLDTSSVVMFTPASQDIIFLDDSSDSFNIESMDLLKDLMNPTESLSNLKRLESDRIKLLQKTNGSGNHAGYITPSKCSDFDEKQNLKSLPKTEYEFHKPKDIEKTEVKKSPIEEKAAKKNNNHKSAQSSPPKTLENVDSVKKARIFDVDCDECQTYIKYLGARLSDKEIEQHLRNCTNHKKRICDNLTPDGFWDPIIKPFASDDPRNLTIIDDPVVAKKS